MMITKYESKTPESIARRPFMPILGDRILQTRNVLFPALGVGR